MNSGISKKTFYCHIISAWFFSVIATNIVNDRLKLKHTGFHADIFLTCVAFASIVLIVPMAVLLRKVTPFNLQILFLFDLVIVCAFPVFVYRILS